MFTVTRFIQKRAIVETARAKPPVRERGHLANQRGPRTCRETNLISGVKQLISPGVNPEMARPGRHRDRPAATQGTKASSKNPRRTAKASMRMIGRIAATNPKHSRPSRHILTKQTARYCIVKWIQVPV